MEGDSTSNGPGAGMMSMTAYQRGSHHLNHNHRGQQHHLHQRQMNWARQRSMSMCGGGFYPPNLHHHHHPPAPFHAHHSHPENGNASIETISRQRRASEGSASLIAKRAKRWRRRHPLIRNSQAAPNNNNEFLMDVHDSDHAPFGDDLHDSSPEDEEDFQSKDFTETYNVLKSERLHGMSREQLIYANQLLEQRVETLEHKLNEILKEKLEEKKGDDVFAVPNAPPPRSSSSTSSPAPTLRFVKQEMLRLRQENWELKMENSSLKSANSAAVNEGVEEAAPPLENNAQHLDNHQHGDPEEEEEEGGMMETEYVANSSPHHRHHFFRPAQTTAGI